MEEVGNPPKRRLSRRRIGCLLVTCLLVAAAGWLGHTVYQAARWGRLFGYVEERINSLKSQRPANVTPEHWEEAVGWGRTAFANLWSWDVNNWPDLEVFAAALDEKIAQGDGLATLRWLWDELERRAERGPMYAAAFKPVRAMTPDPITDDNVGDLWGLSACATLDLSGTEVSDTGLSRLAKAKNLSTLLLNDTRVTERGLAQLSALQHLEGLQLRRCKKLGAANPTGLSGLAKLRGLDLTDTPIGDRQLAGLKLPSQITHLNLSNTAITDQGLSHLVPLVHLIDLDLSGTQVAGPGLKYLGKLPSLSGLNLSRTPLADRDLQSLKDLVELESLCLDKTKVTDDGLKHLAGLSHLKHLRLEGTGVKGQGLKCLTGLRGLESVCLPADVTCREELQRFHDAVPGCTVYIGGQCYEPPSEAGAGPDP
jgi:hypothetical protein